MRAYLDWVKKHPCYICMGVPTDPHHLPLVNKPRRSRDEGNVIPLCRRHHDYYHKYPMAEEERMTEFKDLAVAMVEQWGLEIKKKLCPDCYSPMAKKREYCDECSLERARIRRSK